eukprot:5227443-Pyramimonas_sp.AAC.1
MPVGAPCQRHLACRAEQPCIHPPKVSLWEDGGGHNGVQGLFGTRLCQCPLVVRFGLAAQLRQQRWPPLAVRGGGATKQDAPELACLHA